MQAASNSLPESPVRQDAADDDDDDDDDIFRDDSIDDARAINDCESDARERSDRFSKCQRQNLQQRLVLEPLDFNSK